MLLVSLFGGPFVVGEADECEAGVFDGGGELGAGRRDAGECVDVYASLAEVDIDACDASEGEHGAFDVCCAEGASEAVDVDADDVGVAGCCG